MSEKKKTIKRTIVFPEGLYKKIEEIAKRKNVPTSSILKIACSEYVEKMEENQEK